MTVYRMRMRRERRASRTHERAEEARVQHGGVEALLGEDERREGPERKRHEQAREDELADPLVCQAQLLRKRYRNS